MKTINIYLTTKQKDKLSRLQNQYKLSLSTIVDIIAWNTYQTMMNKGKNYEEIWASMILNYMQTGNKTSIKPKRVIKDIKPFLDRNTSCFITNSIQIYLENEINQYTNKDGVDTYYEKILKEFKETKEDYWNYNAKIKQWMRFERENKKYLEKMRSE